MAKVFEDEFTEIQSGMVSLAIEALETVDMTVDKIYIYAFGTEHEGFFNLFFVKDGKLLHNNQVGVSEDIIDQVLDLGIEDTFKLIEVCQKYGRQAPCQYKLVYDCHTGHFDGDYSYDDLSDTLYGSSGALDDWEKEIDASLRDKQQ